MSLFTLKRGRVLVGIICYEYLTTLRYGGIYTHIQHKTLLEWIQMKSLSCLPAIQK